MWISWEAIKSGCLNTALLIGAVLLAILAIVKLFGG